MLGAVMAGYSDDFLRVMGEADMAAETISKEAVMAIIEDGLREAQREFHGRIVAAGWHDSPRETGTLIALIHSELSEGLEALRTGAMDNHLPHRLGIEVELADALIRIFDLAGKLGLDIAGAVIEKARYNETRADHQRETRVKRF